MSWTPSPELDVAGYRVYCGSAPRTYAQARGAGLNAGTNTRYVVSGLQRGSVYYFAVTSYDTAGNESGYSVEVQRAVP